MVKMPAAAAATIIPGLRETTTAAVTILSPD